MPLRLSGDIKSGQDFGDRINEVQRLFKNRLPRVARRYEREFVETTLSVRGPRTLGQVTGNLAAAFTVQPSRRGEFGNLTQFVRGGTATPDPAFYGEIQDDQRGWFSYGTRINSQFLSREIAKALDDAAEAF